MPHELLALVSRTSQGDVWRARHDGTGAVIAIKKPGGPPALASIRHPNIVPLLECDEHQMVMEWIEGGSLESSAPLDADAFHALVHQTLGGLAAIHEAGFLHLDLKPENILVPLGSAAPRFLIADFGNARPAPATATLKGSVHYMAPECFEGGMLDERADLYSLGCVFYFALTGRPAFEGDLAPQVITAHLHHRCDPLPGLLGAWIDRLLARNPAERPSGAKEALAQFPGPS